jgi:hypothetical protein
VKTDLDFVSDMPSLQSHSLLLPLVGFFDTATRLSEGAYLLQIEWYHETRDGHEGR